jgi:hypothetical protein
MISLINNDKFCFYTIFSATSPGVIVFSPYAQAQKYLGVSITGFTLCIFTVYGAPLVFAGMFLLEKKLLI